MEIENTVKRGYLNEDYRLFHIKDRRALDLDYHYHEFDKIVVFISGKVTYIIEGKSYFLQPWDILLVGHDRIHRPLIDTSEPYERIILWMNTDFIRTNSAEAYDLSQCFRLARQRSFSLLRPEAGRRPEIMKLLNSVEEAARSSEYAHELLARTYFLQFMIELNRMAETDDTENDATAYKSDPKMEELIGYINENLRGDLSLDRLAQEFFISKSHLMHKFKSVAGCTAHSYILQKRLMLAADHIKNGMPVTCACEESGFSDYTAFLKAFKKMFGTTPKMMA
jgi:AraC-like DNA-binding protein